MCRPFAILVFCCALCAGRAAGADEVWTDANIVTGLDFSGSIESPDAQLEVDGIAMALRSPQIIAAIQNGNHKRIGFTVFVWADGNYPALTGWRLISSPQDALALSKELADRLYAILDSDVPVKLGALTDLSSALDYGGELLRSAPFPTSHQIVNIIGNGIDNVKEGPRAARDQLVAQGMTINAVALGYDMTIYKYFKRDVIGGPKAFVLSATDPEALVEVLARKFVTEIAGTIEPMHQASR